MKRNLLTTLLVLLMTISFVNAAADREIRVGLVRISNDSNTVTLNLSGEHVIYDDSGQLLKVENANNYHFSMVGGNLVVSDDMALFGSDEKLIFASKQTIIKPSSGSRMRINGVEAVGSFMLGETAKGQLIPVLRLDIETYLRGVVPREMSPSRPLEALKAQAVAARTFCIRQLGRHEDNGYDVCDTTNCQVYGGVESYHGNSDRAIAETAGLCVAYQGKPAEVFYHASSGGYLENSEDIFSAPLDYLVAGEDPYSVSDQYQWTAQFSLAELSDRFAARGYQIGSIRQIIVDKRLPSGRIVALTVVGDAGQAHLEKERIRAAFGYSALKSLLFTFEGEVNYYVQAADGYISQLEGTLYAVAGSGQARSIDSIGFSVAGRQNNNDSADIITDDFVVNGRGWGHGLGMSQFGAEQMAAQGFDFREILQFYYKNTEIVDMDQLKYEDE